MRPTPRHEVQDNSVDIVASAVGGFLNRFTVTVDKIKLTAS